MHLGVGAGAKVGLALRIGEGWGWGKGEGEDVPVHHVLCVQVRDARHDLDEEASRLGLAAAPVLHNVLEQLALRREPATRARTLGPPMRAAATS